MEAAARAGDAAVLRALLPQLEARLTRVVQELGQADRASKLIEMRPGRKTFARS